HGRRSAIARHCLGQISAMLHRRFMPLSTPKRERVRRAVAAVLMIACGLIPPATAQAAELPRIASINVCTDQLLMALADPAQILGLSPYARDPALSWDAAKAGRFPK